VNIKQIAGVAFAALGIFLIGYGTYSKSHVSAAKKEIHQMTESRNPIVRSAGITLEKKVEAYDSKMNWSFVGGALFILGGVGAAYLYRYRKKKKKEEKKRKKIATKLLTF